ncbi:MAG: hypothetical protein LBN00_03645 [Oscillospiraceae bacterium]|jgi:hypothetical protein|nr:hypothetical protein [Oscillospiraceae bacterium]
MDDEIIGAEIAPWKPGEDKMLYRQSPGEGFHRWIGRLRGDFGSAGDQFYHAWFDPRDGESNANKSPEFQAEFQSVMTTLRQSVLKNYEAMALYCCANPDAKLPGRDGRFGFKLETESRQYFINCTTLRDDYFYIFAYDKPAREREQPSVHETITAARSAPPAPRKTKSEDKHKTDIEH